MSNRQKSKGHAIALLPFLVFIAIYLGAGLVMQARGVDMAFYQFPSVVAAFIGVLVAFLIGKGSINEKFAVFAKGAGNENVMTMLIIYILAGAFSAVAGAMGGVESTANLGLKLVPAQFLVAGVFIISCFLAVATGTSMGTIGAIVPIAMTVADKAGLSMSLVLAACVGGAMFGDNLSMISDTTIAATKTQGCELRDKFKVNFFIALPAAILSIVLLLIFGRPDTVVPLTDLSFDIIKVLPYLLVLILALIGINVFLSLTIGILSAGLVGIFYGELTIFTFAQNVWQGFQNMNEVFFLSLFVGGIAGLATKFGGIDWLLNQVSKIIKGKKSAEIGIAALVSVADIATANNTVAIIITGPMAKDISTQYKVDPRKSASLLDIFSCIWQGAIPYGAQLLLACSLVGGMVSPVDILPRLWYQQLLLVFGIIAIFVPFANRTIKKDPWNWEYDCAESQVEAKKKVLEAAAEEVV